MARPPAPRPPGAAAPLHGAAAPLHRAEPCVALLTLAAFGDGETATTHVGCRVSQNVSLLTHSPFPKKLLGELCYFFLGVAQSLRSFSREMGSAGQCPQNGERREPGLLITPLAPSPHFPCQDGTYCLFKVSSAPSDDKHRKTAHGGPTFTISWAKLLSAFPE